MKNLDFVALGDIVIDSFIRLQQGHVTENPKELCMPYGTKIPFEFAEEVPAVGNSANASVSAARLGLSSGLIVNIGDDQHGKECIERLTQEKVSTEFVSINKGFTILQTTWKHILKFDWCFNLELIKLNSEQRRLKEFTNELNCFSVMLKRRKLF
jgi:bifunctional ADP-heptose synthase (sugar kinase/adenylyltransferase)